MRRPWMPASAIQVPVRRAGSGMARERGLAGVVAEAGYGADGDDRPRTSWGYVLAVVGEERHSAGRS